MVLLITANANPTMADIDTYLLHIGRTPESLRDIKRVVREIECKSGAGALLHPADEYFVAQCSSLLSL
jgi:hypothetical protein